MGTQGLGLTLVPRSYGRKRRRGWQQFARKEIFPSFCFSLFCFILLFFLSPQPLCLCHNSPPRQGNKEKRSSKLIWGQPWCITSRLLRKGEPYRYKSKSLMVYTWYPWKESSLLFNTVKRQTLELTSKLLCFILKNKNFSPRPVIFSYLINLHLEYQPWSPR